MQFSVWTLRGFVALALFTGGCTGQPSSPAGAPSPGAMSPGMMSPAMTSPGMQGSGMMGMNGRGVVRAIRDDRSGVTIEHEAIPAMNMSAMTMEFSVKDAAVLDGIAAGDAVDFTLVMGPDGRHVVERVQKRASAGGAGR